MIYMPEINNNNYNIWSKQLSQAWGNQDLSKDHYKLKTHPTYPDLGDKSWSRDNKIY